LNNIFYDEKNTSHDKDVTKNQDYSGTFLIHHDRKVNGGKNKKKRTSMLKISKEYEVKKSVSEDTSVKKM